ncbi:MAG: SDR family oxidoreductase, partial [Sphingomonas sp.]|nr:SDR family oxidoreductase [Sphingomonas sp.]
MGRLQGKITLITGAARGIGEGIVRAFAREGATIWITDIDEEGGRALAEELGLPHRFARLDVAVEEDWAVVDRLVA